MKKRNVMILVILLVIGFASVSTTFVLNGVVGVGANKEDFDVIFISATIDGEESTDVTISENKKSITFSTNKLTELNDKSIMDYKVKNNSTQYGANVIVSCNTTGNEYVSVTGEFANTSLPITTSILMEAQEIKNGFIKSELIKSYAGEDTSISITCEINGSAISRDSRFYTVDFDSQGGSKVEDIIVTKNDTYGELPIPEKEGYIFKGWYNEKGEKIDNDTIVEIDKNTTIHAEWEITLTQFVEELARTDEVNLAYDDTTDNNLRYIGANPNNYVMFNGELWRIIGVMNNITESDGNKASHIKIIRNASIGNLAWASNNVNNWNTSSLQTLLNSGDYFNRSGPYSTTGLTADSKKLISNVVWKLGGWSGGALPAQSFYLKERGTNVYSGRPTAWTGYVGLMYTSDFIYAVGGSDRSTCLSQYSSSCSNNVWMNINNTCQWTITPNDQSASYVNDIHDDGRLNNKESSRAYGVQPVVYLDSKVIKVSGNGSSSDPFIIK